MEPRTATAADTPAPSDAALMARDGGNIFMKGRFIALDQVRGLAIICMILAHFGPGLYDRVGLSGAPLDFLSLIGRMATPAFVLIFGITLAIVYIPRAQRNPVAARAGLIKRSLLVLACAFVIALPESIVLFVNGAPDSTNGFWFDLLLCQYNVLLFYAVAIFVTGLLIGHIARDPVRFGVVYGSILIFIGSYLGYNAWPPKPGEAIELVRLLLVSGKYGVFVLLGCAWMIIAVGILIQQRLKSHVDFNRDILIIAAALLLVALSDGRIVGWRTLQDLHMDYDAPPQFWYLSMVASAMLFALVFLHRHQLPVVSFLLEHIGRSPLSIYVAHKAVLPAIAFLRWGVPGIPEILIIAGCFTAFLAFCAFKIWRSATIARRKSAKPS